MSITRTLSIPFFFLGSSLYCAHLPGGNITYECLGGNEYQFTLTLFRECGGTPLFPQGLFFASDCGGTFTISALPVGDGTEVSQLCPEDLANSTCNGGTLPGIEVYQIQTTLPLSPCNGWTISWEECCRSNAVNIAGNPGTYIEARLYSVNAPCNNSPQFTQNVIPYVCLNEPVSYNLAVTEPDGHQLRYRLITARQMQPPIPVNYHEGNTGAQPFPGMVIDSLTGQITFTPTMIGNVVTVVRVDEYLPNGQLAGSVMRDFPFVVIDCPNTPPDETAGQMNQITGDTITTEPMGISICADGAFCFNASFNDADAGQTLLLSTNIADVLPGVEFNTSGTNPITAQICWNGGMLAPGSYGFVITAEDDACPTTGLTTYAYTITVLEDTVPSCLGTTLDRRIGQENGVSIWPSPASDHLNVALPGYGTGVISIHDDIGRVVFHRNVTPGNAVIPLSGIVPGVYVVRVMFRDADIRQRVVIAR